MLRSLLRTEGPLGLYRGAAASALTWAPYFFTYFWAYDLLTSSFGNVPVREGVEARRAAIKALQSAGALGVKTMMTFGFLGGWGVPPFQWPKVHKVEGPYPQFKAPRSKGGRAGTPV